MKRLFLMIGAVAALALPVGDLALAQGRRHGRGDDGWPRAERGYGDAEGPQRGGPRGGGPQGPGRSGRFEDAPPRGYGRGEPRRFEEAPRGRAYFDDGPRGRPYDDGAGPRDGGRRRFDEPAPRAFAPQAARRGGYLPDRFRGGVVEDYRRFRLRPPPHGYAWVRVGSGFALVSEDTGRVFDIIPD